MHDSTVSRPVLGPVTSTVFAASSFVAVAAYLGAEWPRVMTLGAPVGVWAVLAAAGGVWYSLRRPGGERFGSLLHRRVTLDWLPRLAPMGYTFVKRVALACGVTDRAIERAEDGWVRRLDRAADSAPLSVGLDVGPELAASVMKASTPTAVRWVDLAGPGASSHHGPLDAAVSAGNGLLRITTRESEEREASWYDWSNPRPLSYSSVFPLRVDPSRLTLGEWDGASPEAVAALAVAAAALSRSPARLTLADRLAGRRAVSAATVDAAMQRLVEVALDEDCPPALRAPALRAAGAYLSTAERADAALRLRVARAAASALPGEPEAHLRLAAACFAGMDDEAGYDAAARAELLIRSTRPEPIQNHLAFLQSEVELGLPTPATLGRVAAGIALVCACAPVERVPYMRDDLLDDLRYSGWLVGRDQDRAVLIELFRRLGAGAPMKAAA